MPPGSVPAPWLTRLNSTAAFSPCCPRLRRALRLAARRGVRGEQAVDGALWRADRDSKCVRDSVAASEHEGRLSLHRDGRGVGDLAEDVLEGPQMSYLTR